MTEQKDQQDEKHDPKFQIQIVMTCRCTPASRSVFILETLHHRVCTPRKNSPKLTIGLHAFVFANHTFILSRLFP